jgi:hypothetical protein
MSTAAISQLFDRLRRLCLATEAENERLRQGRALAEQRITDLRDENERLKGELAAERSARAEMVDQVIDWMGQGEEIVRAGVAGVAKGGSESLAPGQVARAAVRGDMAEQLGGARERMTTADFARTFGGPDLQS